MFFSQALGKFPLGIREVVYAKLDRLTRESSIDQQMVQNMYVESQLQEEDWDDLISRIIREDSPEDIENSIREFCRARTQRGGFAEISKDWIFAHVATLEQLCSHLVKLKYFTDGDEAKASIEPILGSPVEELIDWDGRILGVYQFWSTFGVAGGDRPFGSTPLLDEVLCVLGLTRTVGSLYLLLEFMLPSSIEAHTPTFCDAYAGDFWSRYFRPSPPGGKWGLTMPTDTCLNQIGRPEIVSNAVSANHLCFPLRYV